jgi:hypothetical protein
MYSVVVITIKTYKPKWFDNVMYWGEKFLYTLDAFMNRKLIEPYEWDRCVCWLDEKKKYNEEYDDDDQLYNDSKSLFFLRNNTFTQVYTGLSRMGRANTIKGVKYNFLFVYYKCDNPYDGKNEEIEMNIPLDQYAENNQILSYLYVIRYLKHHHPTAYFDMTYTLEIMDFDLKTISLSSNECIVLYENTYQIRQLNISY